jgi:hypothetical protein
MLFLTYPSLLKEGCVPVEIWRVRWQQFQTLVVQELDAEAEHNVHYMCLVGRLLRVQIYKGSTHLISASAV